jgi:hypothetical protein
MRARLASAGLTMGVILSASVAGCSGHTSPPTGSPGQPSSSQAPAKPAVTAASARSLLTSYVAVNNTANARFDGKLEARAETVPQITLDRVTYRIQKRLHQQPFAQFTYRNPHFYIPSLPAAAPKWFAADAAAVSGKKAQRQLLLFVQQKPDGPWKLSAVTNSTTSQRVRIALSPAGFATTAAAGDRSLAIAPAQLPARHAALLNGKHGGGGFAAGRWTSHTTQGIRAFKSAYGKAGWNYHDDWAVAGYPSYALRTKDGGAVVWYFLKDRQTAARTGSAGPLHTGTVVRALTGKSSVTHRFTIDSISEFVAVIPPKGKVKVMAGYTGNVAATAS